MYGAVWVKSYKSHRKSVILFKIMQHERKLRIKQELGLYKNEKETKF